MMKEICAQCLQPHRDPVTGKVSYVFSCFNQDQPLDRVDFRGLAARLAQNSVQEKLTAQWIGHCLRNASAQTAIAIDGTPGSAEHSMAKRRAGAPCGARPFTLLAIAAVDREPSAVSRAGRSAISLLHLDVDELAPRRCRSCCPASRPSGPSAGVIAILGRVDRDRHGTVRVRRRP